jgi:H+/Cl- antiporter ClcA
VSAEPLLTVPPTDIYPNIGGITSYLFIGLMCGIAASIISKCLFFVEDLWEKTRLPPYIMPAIASIAVGIIGYLVPRTLGVGYNNISDMASASLSQTETFVLFVAKTASWVIALSSGSSGGTLAPLFTIGSGIGASFGMIFHVRIFYSLV